MAKNTITFTRYHDDGTEEDVELPSIFTVCPDCKGQGTTYLGWRAKDQPAFSREDFEAEGADFEEDYRSGRYDRDCEGCGGKRVILTVHEFACDKAILAEYHKRQQDDAAYAAECEAERRMGA